MQGSLLALLDDIASALDDIALLTKVAVKKTAGVLGDDLALNAEQVIGIHANRELPVVWAVAKGSLINKLILIPLALLISFVLPPLVSILLMIGGLYLCFEGFEKIIEKIAHKDNEHEKIQLDLQHIDIHQFEKDRIRGAIRTDFVLSAEIIVITLGTVATTALSNQVMVLTLIGLIMTIGVYGLVACIVKLDDLGFILREKRGALKTLGIILIGAAPILMKGLAVAGTIAMFLVGGSIVAHGLPFIHHYTGHLSFILSVSVDFTIGILGGALVTGIYFIFKKVKAKFSGCTTA
jgi:predicted DNA repair protein MutK